MVIGVAFICLCMINGVRTGSVHDSELIEWVLNLLGKFSLMDTSIFKNGQILEAILNCSQRFRMNK